MTTVTFILHDYLKNLLRKKHRGGMPLVHQFDRRASVKDVVESLGIPHPVIGSLMINGREADFTYILQDNDRVEVSPLVPPVDPCVATVLRSRPLKKIAFVVDVNAGKLALYLRMLGFDTVYGNDLRNGRLAAIAQTDGRILLTRDTSLLKRKIIDHGYLLREQAPVDQLVEVARLYDLSDRTKPLTRCIPCNGLLMQVSKSEIIDRLEPLTRKYYHSFRICEECRKIYWPGTHQDKIHVFIEGILAAVRRGQGEVG